MPTPDFVLALRTRVGHDLLWMPAVTAVVLRGDQVLLVRRSDNGRWGPVTGIVDPGEHPDRAARREVLEEAGVRCEVERLADIHVDPPMVHVNGDRAQYLDHTYRCAFLSGEAHPADEESTDAAWFPLQHLPDVPEQQRRRIEAAVSATSAVDLP